MRISVSFEILSHVTSDVIWVSEKKNAIVRVKYYTNLYIFDFFKNFAIVKAVGIYASTTRTLSEHVESDRARNFNRERKRDFVPLFNY